MRGLASTMILGRVTEDPCTPPTLRPRRILLERAGNSCGDSAGFAAVITNGSPSASHDVPTVQMPDWASFLADGDVVAVSSTPSMHVLYRRSASTNSFLVTERCSSNCIMCSQPPKAKDDSWLYELAINAVDFVPDDTPEIGITGGEPLLNAQGFLGLLYRLKTGLPRTAVHVLTNGRLLAYLKFAQAISEIRHPDLMLGIPLYSADCTRHDFIVQARGAFDQTIRGMLNAKRFGLRIELRVVLHEQSAPALLDLARFIARNLPFVDQVALMGLEHIGFVKANANVLKAHPDRYHDVIVGFTNTLQSSGVRVHIFNLPLCFLPSAARGLARRSISDWKNDLPRSCETCALQDECCGFFSWNVAEYENSVRPFSNEEARQFRGRLRSGL